MAYDVFISHSSKDKTVADAACARLESRGIRCWIAPRDIRPGDEWGSSIIKAIRGARIMVLIFSSHANASPQIRREVERAVNAGATVIPVRIEDVLPQESLDYFLGTPHWLDAFTPPLEQHLDRLAAVIHEILEISAPVPVGAAPESGLVTESASEPAPLPTEIPPARPESALPPSKPPGKGWLIGVGVVLAVLILGALGYYYGIATPAEKVRQAEIAQKQADEKAASAEAEKEKADSALAQAQSDAEKAAAQKAKEDADARAAAAQQAADQAKADADKAKQAAASPTAAGVGPVAGQAWTNSLGVKFVPAGTDGVLFSVWDVRVKDYALFVKETGHDWPKPNMYLAQTENDPAVMVSWYDAKAFCDWLTKKEQTEGKLGAGQGYRLPTDAEWSKAVGLGEEGTGTPSDKDGKTIGIFPWGDQWPPPKDAGNYGDVLNSWKTLPVGTFNANLYGLYDMGGNVWQWCEDKYDNQHNTRVSRGGSWQYNGQEMMLSSFRRAYSPDFRTTILGLRLVMIASP